MASEKVAFWVGASSAIGEAGLQMSGYQNQPASIVFGVVAALGLGYALFHHLRERRAGGELNVLSDAQLRRRKRWKRRLNAFIHALPIIGILSGGFLFVGSIAWVLADVRKQNDEVSRTLTRYVLPRHLTDIQISAISNYLQKFPPKDVKFIVVKNNEEAGSYRADFQRALVAGGWTISEISYSDDIGEGVSTEFNEPQVNANARPDPKNPKADQLFAAALKDAHMRPSGSTSSGSGSGITAETFVIKIGRRRMDDGDLIVKKQIQERKRRLLQEEEESVADD